MIDSFHILGVGDNSVAGPWDTVFTVSDNQKTSHELSKVDFSFPGDLSEGDETTSLAEGLPGLNWGSWNEPCSAMTSATCK